MGTRIFLIQILGSRYEKILLPHPSDHGEDYAPVRGSQCQRVPAAGQPAPSLMIRMAVLLPSAAASWRRRPCVRVRGFFGAATTVPTAEHLKHSSTTFSISASSSRLRHPLPTQEAGGQLMLHSAAFY